MPTGKTDPVGTIRLRKRSPGHVRLCRFIKVRDDGPFSKRWIPLARHWWLTNKGPVPAGKRVCHLDGDSLNDDPANYGLLTPGDVMFVQHERNPAMSRRNRKKCARALARSNRERAAVRRLREWLPSQWYAVDVEAREVLNVPHRKRWQVYTANGVVAYDRDGVECVGRGGNGACWEATAMGWHLRLSSFEACILNVLIGGGWLVSTEVRTRAGAMHEARGLRSGNLSTRALYSAIWRLKKAGLVRVRRWGGVHAQYHIAPEAIALRRPPCRFLPVRGADLGGERFNGFARVTPGVSEHHTASRMAMPPEGSPPDPRARRPEPTPIEGKESS